MALIAHANSQNFLNLGADRRWSAKTLLVEVTYGSCCAHGDGECARILTESGIMLWYNQLLNTILSRFLNESCACNLRPETWRRWLSVCLRKHLMLLRALALWLPNQHISSRGTSSAHNAVFLTESDIISLLCMVTHGITNKSPSKVFLR